MAPDIERRFGNIYTAIQSMFSLVQGPSLAILLLGVLWRRATAWGGLAGLVSGVALAFTLNLDSMAGMFHSTEPYLFVAWWSFVLSLLVTVVVSLATPPEPPEKIRGLVVGEMRRDPALQVALERRMAAAAARTRDWRSTAGGGKGVKTLLQTLLGPFDLLLGSIPLAAGRWVIVGFFCVVALGDDAGAQRVRVSRRTRPALVSRPALVGTGDHAAVRPDLRVGVTRDAASRERRREPASPPKRRARATRAARPSSAGSISLSRLPVLIGTVYAELPIDRVLNVASAAVLSAVGAGLLWGSRRLARRIAEDDRREP